MLFLFCPESFCVVKRTAVLCIAIHEINCLWEKFLQFQKLILLLFLGSFRLIHIQQLKIQTTANHTALLYSFLLLSLHIF